jgi:hypothetical protein
VLAVVLVDQRQRWQTGERVAPRPLSSGRPRSLLALRPPTLPARQALKIGQLRPANQKIIWSRETETDLVPPDFQYRQADVVTDDNLFADPATQDQHGPHSFRGIQAIGAANNE